MRESFETDLEQVITAATITSNEPELPGVVVYARRGENVFHRAFGLQNIQDRIPMQTDCVFRMYSMTKVLTNAVALMLYERDGKNGRLFQLNDPVSKFLPDFDRDWFVVSESIDSSDKSVEYADMLTGAPIQFRYKLTPSRQVMKIKHLMAESSGIGYESFSDWDRKLDGKLGIGNAYSIATALRREKADSTFYRSSCILGHDASLQEICSKIAKAGVLVSEPGTFSYGHGNAILGRIVEIVYQQMYLREKNLGEIMEELLFEPLGMRVSFFLDSSDPRVNQLPVLYGLDAKGACVRAEHSVPATQPAYSNHIDHYEGPRRYLSGDTGTCMTVQDYAKFCNFLLNRGLTEKGHRLLSEAGVHALTHQRLRGLEYGPLARAMGVSPEAPYPATFNFGWASTFIQYEGIEEYATHHHPRCNYWSGYANTHVRLYADDDAFIIIGTQLMNHHFSPKPDNSLRLPLIAKFLQTWKD
jgi:CubicO group peptidase (beta-lactamase class C family)